VGDSDCNQRIKEIIRNIDICHRKRIDLYGVLGSEFAHLKYRTMKAICAHHVSSNDIHEILSCVVCIRKLIHKPNLPLQKLANRTALLYFVVMRMILCVEAKVRGRCCCLLGIVL